jgi:hypothetical protein
MDREKNRKFRLFVVSMPFQNLVYAFAAAKIDQVHMLKIQFPFSIQNVRIICSIIAFLSLLSLPFINRHIRSKVADRMRGNHIDPELILLLINLMMLLLPVMCVLFLFFLGLPVNDVYFYSYLSFILMLGLLVEKRKIVWPADILTTTTKSDSYTIPIIRSYTVVLSLLTALALLLLTVRVMLMINPPPEYSEPFFVNLPWTLIYALIVIGCTLAVILRFRNSHQAIAFTTLISPLLAFWIPFGTAGYFCWRFKIKPRELPKDANIN